MDYWVKILDKVRAQVSPESFRDWFEQTTLHSLADQEIIVRVPNRYYVEWLTENFTDILRSILENMGLGHYSIRYVVEEDASPKPVQPIQPVQPVQPAPSAQTPAFRMEPTLEAGHLNPRYSFEEFVVGPSNRFAHSAAMAVAERPASAYNPFYIYGGVGLGKTHLMHAIGHHLRRVNPHLRIVYMSSERFMNEMINCLRYEKMPMFREKYRNNVDILMVDDIQFFSGKQSTQEEFFHTFNALYDSQKQIIISSDCQPKELPNIEERVRSRFEWGLIADIQPPELETRIAILQRRAERDGIQVPEDVIFYIASNVKSNIRELEGTLNRLLAYSDLRGEKIDLNFAKKVLINIRPPESRIITIQKVQKVVADYFKLKVNDLLSKNNAKAISEPRQIAMYLCKELTDHSLPRIGKEFNGKHHTTVLYAIDKISAMAEKDPDFRATLNKLRGLIE